MEVSSTSRTADNKRCVGVFKIRLLARLKKVLSKGDSNVMSTLALSTSACEEFKQDVIKGNVMSAQKKLDTLKVFTE